MVKAKHDATHIVYTSDIQRFIKANSSSTTRIQLRSNGTLSDINKPFWIWDVEV
jgi:hypothetical protein